MICKGETVQRSYLLKYAAKFFIGLRRCSERAPVFFRVLRHTMEKYVFFFTESSRWSPLFRRSSTCYIRKHSTHSSYCSPDFVLCMRVICRMWARLRSSLWEKDDFPSSKPPIASAMISNLSNNGFLLCAVFFSMLTAVWPSLWRVRLTFFTHCTFFRKTRQRYGFYPEGDVFLQF